MNSGRTKLISLSPGEKVLSTEKIRETRPSGEENRESFLSKHKRSPAKSEKLPEPEEGSKVSDDKTQGRIIDVVV